MRLTTLALSVRFRSKDTESTDTLPRGLPRAYIQRQPCLGVSASGAQLLTPLGRWSMPTLKSHNSSLQSSPILPNR